ncbi:MAG: ATPase [Bacillota bacterium]|nr:ATPase [Bacillota bacterium]
MEDFRLDLYFENKLEELRHSKGKIQSVVRDEYFFEFHELCQDIKEYMSSKLSEGSEKFIEIQKKAIRGYENEVNYFLKEIDKYLIDHNKQDVLYPSWYDSLKIAIFHERWGFSGIYQWLKMNNSSSCKIIGERIYFMENGKQTLQRQTISSERLEQLKNALLLGNPEKRKNDDYHEVYMADGTRIEIFNKAKQHSVVFRKYVITAYTFEEQVRLKTIMHEMIPLLKSMVACGFNVIFGGPPRTGKTSYLTTYQSYEDPTLEGVMIETDPEIPLHIIMPTAPILQLIVDDEELEKVIKPLMRSDGDYLIMGEARTGRALNLAVEITKKGTRRVKMSFHTGSPVNFSFDVAQMITKEVGGDIWANMVQVAEGFHYIFVLQQLPYDKSIKKLKGIYELRFDAETLLISSHQICKYDQQTDSWSFKYDIGERIEEVAYEEDPYSFETFKSELKLLSEKYPMTENHVKISPYSRLMTGNFGVGGGSLQNVSS